MKKVLVVLFILFLFVGCASHIKTKPSLDVGKQVDQVRELIPDNDQFTIRKEVHTVDDVLHNSAEYLRAWQMWESYALSLDTLVTSLTSQLTAL